MPSPILYPFVGGVRHSFASIEAKLNGQIFLGFKSIDYDRTRTRAEARGNHPDPLGKTRGENAYTASVTLYLAEWNLFMLQTLGTNASGYGDVFFPIYVTFTENGFDTIVDTLIGCTIDSTKATQAQGPDPLLRQVDFAPLKILFNGIDDLAVPLVAPPGS